MTNRDKFKKIKCATDRTIVEVISVSRNKHITRLFRDDVFVAERCIDINGVHYVFRGEHEKN